MARTSLIVSLTVAALVLTPSLARAKGQAKPTEPAFTTPEPVRGVRLGTVGTRPFQLPNGSRVDLAADLETLLLTAVASTPSLAPAEASSDDPCERRMEVRAAISTLDLNVAELGVRFGYTPSGETSTVTSVQGSLGVKIGTLAMDFSLWECERGRCTAVGASTATQATAGVELAFEIAFGEITTGPALLFNTPLGETVRKIMQKGMERLAASARIHELPWQAVVRAVNSEDGTFIFDSGARHRLKSGQTFTIYAVEDGGTSCDVFRALAHVHTVQVDTVSSVATVDRTLGSRSPRVGDLVMVRLAGSQ
ncbi:MAG: hypothetical protein IT285_02745 [Bdellovibrionales bacterium]|nr:hypothetical protein [Bdellovibrionales bacterium]